MKNLIKSITLILLACLLFGCSGTPTPTQTATPQEVVPIDTETPGETSTSLTTPIPNENGLTIEENEIVGQPDLDSLSLNPAHGSEEAIRDRHAEEKGEVYLFLSRNSATDGTHTYEANESAVGHDVTITVTRDGETIFEESAGDSSPTAPIRGLWMDDGHWVLEFAYITTTNVDNTNYTNAVGQVTRDGVSLNEQYGYDEIFGYQLLDGKPFYFYTLDGKIHLSYDGEDLPIAYDEVYHYNCCSSARFNPVAGTNWVGFWGVREGVTYYTEIGRY